MSKSKTLLFLSLLMCTTVGVAKDKDSSLERAIKDEIRDEIYEDDKHGGKGKPDNPGEHGRDNAAQKQRENPGQGSKGDGDSWEDIIRDEIDDDSKDKGKKKKNK
jgi:hypothetical protein